MNSEQRPEAAEMERAKKDAQPRVEPGQGGRDNESRHTQDTPSHRANQENHVSQPAAIQRKRILAWLQRHGTMTTLEARNEMHIMHPGGRVMELRRAGYSIITTRLENRVARYILIEEARP